MAMAEERGFDTLNLKDQQAELGINTATDYYNAGHTNIHGSIKYTDPFHLRVRLVPFALRDVSSGAGRLLS